ncbi:MAG: hypothetical protein RBT39_06320 [Azoarcus sp.]|nr:hypothetical protein [Azoarcus sp.]MDX9837159.1 hypothetical protein [Azoarcus sp.]
MKQTASVLWKEADEGWVGYIEETGHTFLIDPFSRFVFDVVSDQRDVFTDADLVTRLLEAAPELHGEDVRARLPSALNMLVAAHLIDSADIETW